MHSCGGKYHASNTVKRSLAQKIYDICKETIDEDSNNDEKFRIDFTKKTLTYSSTLQRGILENKSSYLPGNNFNMQLAAPLFHRPSACLKRLLAFIARRDNAVLDLFAELVARLMFYRIPSEYLWILSGRSCHILTELLKLICGNRAACQIYTVSTGTKTAAALKRCDKCKIHMQYNSNIESPQTFHRRNLAVFKRLINGENDIPAPDPFTPDLGVHYSPLVVYVSPMEIAETKKYFKGLPVKVINLDEPFRLTLLKKSDIAWLQTAFAAYGRHLIQNKTTPEYENDILELLIEQFVSGYCISKSGSYIRCNYFREKLLAYAASLDLRIPSLEHATTLNKKVSELVYLRKSTVRSQGNCLCFMDVEILEDKLAEAIRHNYKRTDYDDKNVKNVSFEKHLNRISDMLDNHLTATHYNV